MQILEDRVSVVWSVSRAEVPSEGMRVPAQDLRRSDGRADCGRPGKRRHAATIRQHILSSLF